MTEKGKTITVKVSIMLKVLLRMMKVGMRPPPKNMGKMKKKVNSPRPTRSRRLKA